MSKNKSQFLDLIKSQRDNKPDTKFEGTFLEYLDVVRENPGVVKHAHKRLNDTVEGFGFSVLPDEDPRKRKIFDGDNIKIYDYFKEEFFGHERVIAKIMRFLKSAALKGEESRQVLLLMGPVGSGKSALAEHIKKAIEHAEPFYHLKDDPQRGEPLQLIPRSLRPEFEKLLEAKIEGDISPVARHVLLEKYKGEYEKFEVVQSTFSQRARRGVAVVPPMDANSQDVSVLIGSEDISKLDKYSEDDPRILSLNGAFNV